MTDIAKNICEFRKKCGLTQRELSEKVGVSIQTVSKWEKGISSPDVNLLPVIASVFEVSIDRLFGCDAETALKDIDDSYIYRVKTFQAISQEIKNDRYCK